MVKDTKASGIKAFIVYPTINYINVNVTITNAEFDDNAVVETVSNYVNSLDIGQSFIIFQAERKIGNVLDTNDVDNDDIDITITEPTSNRVPTPTEIIRVDTLTINGT